ncbi:MAG TPA: hypothetical protein DCR43_09330 [Bacteroidales bacterium]|nr:MAG: hypothetical protein A2X11_03340 [Bacteroidetes bacterium GWE2_42_24]OFY32742.1 MAG: hypothetical protein A2X09_06785 [Bacteroidetes bacterium GWF2_43_11]HAQ66035.1 hypothetical protein [Bacteroidales bacterium]HBZ65268.1 hypothetical protein [Bacteroidales bacterium]
MPEISIWLRTTWLVVVVAALIIGVTAERYKSLVATAALFINGIITTIPAVMALAGQGSDASLNAGLLVGEIGLRIDGLSAWFILIVNFTTLMGAIYGIGYMRSYAGESRKLSLHWILFVVFHLSMVWVCIIQNSLAFLIVWEIMSLSSMLLVIFEHHKAETIKAGINYLIQMHIGVTLLTVAFLWVYFNQHSFDFNAIGIFFRNKPSIWLFLLFFAGFGIKAGFIPFHTWLPHAHPAAPSHVSGVMSGVIVKMGIYGILRIVTQIDAALMLPGGEVVLTLSVITALYGIINSAIHRDIKKMLAFCTIENIGIIGIGIGVGMIGQAIPNPWMMMAGYGGALIHTLNHSLFKSLLFFSAGSIYSVTHTRNMEHLGGLIRKMPITAIIFLVGAMAIGGLPPFNGFVSEFIIYMGLIEGIQAQAPEISTLMMVGLAGMVMAGGLSIITFTKTYGIVFLGTARRELPHEPKEVSPVMWLPAMVIISVMLAIGLFPVFLWKPVIVVVGSFGPVSMFVPGLSLLTSLSQIMFASGGFILLVVIIHFLRKILTANVTKEVSPTWGCGYVAPESRLQYTGKSYSKSLAKLFSFIAIEEKTYKEISQKNIFPRQRVFSSRYPEFFETHVIEKGINLLLRFFNLFLFIHNGRVQSYILYGILFIVVVLVSTMFNMF